MGPIEVVENYFHTERAINDFRLFSAFGLTLVLLELVVLLAYYWRTVIPMRQEIRKGKVLAPPAGWSFAYHVCVLCMVLLAILERLEFAHHDAPVNSGTFAYPILCVVLWIVSRKFHSNYAETLRVQRHKEQVQQNTPDLSDDED